MVFALIKVKVYRFTNPEDWCGEDTIVLNPCHKTHFSSWQSKIKLCANEYENGYNIGSR